MMVPSARKATAWMFFGLLLSVYAHVAIAASKLVATVMLFGFVIPCSMRGSRYRAVVGLPREKVPGLFLDADAQPYVGQRPRIRHVLLERDPRRHHPPEPLHDLVDRRCRIWSPRGSHPVRPCDFIVCPREPLAHAPRPLGQALERVLWCRRHH